MKRLRLFELRDGELYTLFHGINGSRRVPRGVWLKAQRRMVRDGGAGKYYKAGFHVFAPRSEPEKFAQSRFKKPRCLVIVEVEVKNVQPKPTNPEIQLAEYMKVPNVITIIPLIPKAE